MVTNQRASDEVVTGHLVEGADGMGGNFAKDPRREWGLFAIGGLHLESCFQILFKVSVKFDTQYCMLLEISEIGHDTCPLNKIG